MPADIKKVLNKLNVTLKGKSVTAKTKESLAKKWAAKIETDDDIDTYVEDRIDVLEELSSEGDRRATDAVEKAKQKKEDDDDNDDDDDDDSKDDKKDDKLKGKKNPWDKVFEKLDGLGKRIDSIEGEKTHNKLADRFKSHEDIKDIPEEFLEGRFPKSEDEFETAVENAKTKWESFGSRFVASETNDTPGAGTVNHKKADKKEATKEEMEALNAELKI